jgi:X-X-X-Leu-X-X-Gly heptad repeat protein
LVEGLVVENTFDQILRPLAQTTEHSFTLLNIETVIASQNGERYAFVWARSRQIGLGRYLQALGKVAYVFFVELIGGDFLAAPVHDGHPDLEKRLPLTDVAHQISGRQPNVREVHLSVRDAAKHKSAFWGFLSNVYGGSLWDKVILPRLFINHGLSPYFPQVWNLDRVCLYRDQLWLLEIKHKFPFGSHSLCFGINEGELQNISLLHEAGIQCLHALLVKPIWKKGTSSMYLYNRRDLEHRVAAIAMNLGRRAAHVLSTKARVAPRHTSVGGESEVWYYLLNARDFAYMGTLADSSATLADGIQKLIDGKSLETIKDATLQSMRAEEPVTDGSK